MPNKKNNKDPPGILEWIVDFFVSPIAKPLANLFKPVFDILGIDIIGASAANAATAFETSLGKKQLSFSTLSPGIPEDLNAQAFAQLIPVEGAIMAQNMATIIAEAASLGQVDVNINELCHTPAIEATRGIITSIRQAEFREGVYPALRRYQLKQFLPMLPETYRLALAVTKGLLTDAKYYESMAESGLSFEWAQMWRDENYQYPTFGQIAELYWRGVIGDDLFTLLMQRNGYSAETILQLKSLIAMIPPAQDLVTMVVREAFDPKYVTPAPAIFAEYMAKKGFTKDWSDRYWTMHWVPIPLRQAYENLHRGYWTKEQFLEALRIADLHPQWREDVYNVAFGPPSIRELGYGYDVGAYSLSDIVKYRMWGGLSYEDANKAASAMVAYRTEAERNAVRTEYMYLFGRGKISRDDFEQKLVELGTATPAVHLWLERADAYKIRITAEPTPEEPPSITRSTAQWLFENGLRTEDWLRQVLKDLGYIDSAIAAFVDQSKKRIEVAKAKVAEVKVKQLTLAQIRDLYKLGKINEEQLTVEVQKLDYTKDVADRISDLIVSTEELPKPPLELSRTDIVRLYEYHILNIPDRDLPDILIGIVNAEGVNSPTAALYDYFENLGYHPIDTLRLTIWTAIDVKLPILRSRYSKGWISAVQMFNELMLIGIPKDKANEIMETIVKAEQPERTAPEKDLTKSEIIKGAKAGIITQTQASDLLQGIGYDPDEAWYILMINAVVARGDPEGYWEMRKVVEQQKKARGEKAVDIPDDLIMLELKLKEAKAKLEQLKEQKASEEDIGAQAVVVGNFENGMRTMIAKLKLA